MNGLMLIQENLTHCYALGFKTETFSAGDLCFEMGKAFTNKI